VYLEFELPSGPLDGWVLERGEQGAEVMPVVDSATHPDGLRARDYLDPVSLGAYTYRLLVHVGAGEDLHLAHSDWVHVDPPPIRQRSVAPLPWNGDGELRLPAAVGSDGIVELITPDGAKRARMRANADRVLPGQTTGVASGIYLLRWKDASARWRLARLVLQR